jgi:hypothetical protein
MVVLYVYTIQQRNAAEEKYWKYFDAAARCQSQISSLAEKNSLAERYSVVLEELRLEAVKQVQHRPESRNWNPDLRVQSGLTAPEAVMHEPQPGIIDASGPNGVQELGEMFSTSDATIFEGQSGTTPSSLMAELTGWGDFDSLVRTRKTFFHFVLTIRNSRSMQEQEDWTSSSWAIRIPHGTAGLYMIMRD